LKQAGIKKKQVWRPKGKSEGRVVQLQHAWCTFCRMSSWLPLTKLCRRKHL
jgi:hypothetical protein